MDKIVIDGMNHTGDGISRVDGKVIFVSKTISGDIVSIKDRVEYKNYAKASIDTFIKKSEDRVSVKCPYYDLCGGCQIMGLSYDKQLDYKRDKVINIFKRYGDMDINPSIISSKQYGYRNKIVLQVQDGEIGLFKSSSNDIVAIDRCLLVSDNINRIIGIIKRDISVKLVNKIMIRESFYGVMVVFYGEVDENEVISSLKDCVTSIYVNSDCIYGDDFIVDKLGSYKFAISGEAFFQVNNGQTVKLYDKVLEYLGNDRNRVMDLYCGTGSIGIYASSKCNEVSGIEINESAVRNANMNKDINDIKNISFKCGDVSSLISSDDKYDALIVDPPRSGLDKRTKRIIMDIGSDIIIYVSCNPITLVRDINDLKDRYELRDITLVDMFPNTYHVECVILLQRKD